MKFGGKTVGKVENFLMCLEKIGFEKVVQKIGCKIPDERFIELL